MNVVWKQLKVIHLSDLVLCVGITLCQNTLEAPGQGGPNIAFIEDKPTGADKTTWKQYIDSLTADYKTCYLPLGESLSLPHTQIYWCCDKGNGRMLCSNYENTAQDVYIHRTRDN